MPRNNLKLWHEKMHKTRFQHLCFGQLSPYEWSLFWTEDGESRIGPIYRSKSELLGDLTRYATNYGAIEHGQEGAA